MLIFGIGTDFLSINFLNSPKIAKKAYSLIFFGTLNDSDAY
jgi:hypothetical protein